VSADEISEPPPKDHHLKESTLIESDMLNQGKVIADSFDSKDSSSNETTAQTKPVKAAQTKSNSTSSEKANNSSNT